MSGYLMALTAVFFWSINIIIASYFATTLEPFEIAFGRWFIACLILVPMAWSGLKRSLIKERRLVGKSACWQTTGCWLSVWP